MYQTLETIADRLDGFAELTGRLLAWLTLGIVGVTFTVVIMRYLLETGSIALQESVSYLHATVFMLGAAYTLKNDGHVRVDIVYQRLSRVMRAWVNLLGTLLLLAPLCIYIIVASYDYVSVSWSIREGSREAGGLDAVFLLKTAIPLMAALLLLQGVSVMLRSLLVIAGRTSDKAGDHG